MGKITSYTQDTAPTDDDVLIGVDTGTGKNKKWTRSNLLTGNPIIDPTINGSADGDIFTGKYSGWITGLATPNTVTCNGNRSYTLVFNSVDLTSYISPGMRLRTTRTSSAPTQCTSLNGSTQYYSRASASVAGMTFTNNFVVSAWVKMSSYAQGSIISRYNGTSGFDFLIYSSGQVILTGYNGGSGNYASLASYQSIPLNKWVHVTAQLDMTSTTNSPTVNYVMIDGVDVPAALTRAGTNPTALIQAGNLEIGSHNGGGTPFPGKLAQVAIFNAKVTQATIQGYISQGLAGTETSLISAYSFNNSINDLNSNANNLTANGSAVATNADSPFSVNSFGTATGTTDYAIVTSSSFSTNTTVVVQVPEANTIPTSGGVSAMAYSPQKTPYGMPSSRDKWRINTFSRAQTIQVPVSGTWYQLGTMQLKIPIGDWAIRYYALAQQNGGGAGTADVQVTLSTASATESDISWTAYHVASSSIISQNMVKVGFFSLSAATTYYLNFRATTVLASPQLFNRGDITVTTIEAECAYL